MLNTKQQKNVSPQEPIFIFIFIFLIFFAEDAPPTKYLDGLHHNLAIVLICLTLVFNSFEKKIDRPKQGKDDYLWIYLSVLLFHLWPALPGESRPYETNEGVLYASDLDSNSSI